MTEPYPLSRSIVRLMAEAYADEFDAEHHVDPVNDHDYRLAIEFDLLGRPDPPDEAHPWEFDGVAEWWPPRIYPARWQQERIEGYERAHAARWRTEPD